MTLRVQILKDKFSQGLGLPFKELLPESTIKLAISELKIKYKKRLFDPFVTLWAFLSQVLDTDKTCHNAVPDRPGRSQPRVRKRRPKIYPLMTKPRHELRKQLQTA
ncbi:hypothetical protein H6G97_36765 [Nostoc flagelliforme FACHB-838]|uniref:Transposase n=1 Tax=Nostoc flagelliforme FACHB-838 TaxID=2692904 RepID=A0ABR8DZK7_9NOSO|nr:hypothetical protein [Nostoc flagelliforme]MBD2534724.1 hypothetical protein [Nostoc flagelliforme FACHB-838]